MKQVLLAIGRDDPEGAIEHIQAHSELQSDILIYFLKTHQKMESFGQTARSIAQETTIDVAVTTVGIKRFWAEFLLTILASVYMVIFLIKAVQTWFR